MKYSCGIEMKRDVEMLGKMQLLVLLGVKVCGDVVHGDDDDSSDFQARER